MNVLIAIIACSIIIILIHQRMSWNKASFLNTLVRDGDSIRISGDKGTAECRIAGYDSPEWNQPHGHQASVALGVLLKNGYKWKAIDVDDYGRLIINARNAKGSISRQMIIAGYGHNNGKWKLFELFARITRRGLWANSNIIHPKTFRAINPKN